MPKNPKSEKYREYKSEHTRQSRSAARDIQPELDVLLSSVDKAKRAELEADVELWLKAIWPEDYEFEFTPDQKLRIKETVARMLDAGKIAIASPRGDGKTTITEGVAIYGIVKGYIRFLVLLKANSEEGMMMIDNIMDKITRDSFVAMYPEIAYPFVDVGTVKQRALAQHYGGEFTQLEWKKNHIVFPKIGDSPYAGVIIHSFGMDKPCRGFKVGSLRPDFAIIDDPETAQSAVSEGEIKKRSKILDRDLAKLGGQKRTIGCVLLSTIQARDSVSDIYTDVKRKPAWGGIRQQQVKKWPVNVAMWDTYIELRQQSQQAGDKDGLKANEYYIANRAAMDEGVELSNINVYNRATEISAIQSCYNFISDHGLDAFMTECQNEPPIEIEEEGFELSSSAVQKRCNGIERLVIPDGYGWLTAGMDIGGRMLHWVVIAWKNECIGHIVDYGIQPVHGPQGNLTAEENQKDLEEAIRLAILTWSDSLKDKYFYKSGEVRQVDCAAIDARYMTAAVYNAIRASMSKGYIPVMGYGTTNKQLYRKPQQANDRIVVGKGWHKSFHDYNNIKVWQYHVDDDYYKFKVQQAFVIPADAPGSLTLFGDKPFDHKAFAMAIVSEKRVEEFKPGKGLVVEYQVKERNKNHFLDATKYSRMAASVIGVPEYRPVEQATAAVTRDRLRQNTPKPEVGIRTKY